jgi:hypothetical protein
MNAVDWASVFRDVVENGGDIVDIAHILNDRAAPAGDKYIAANVLREEYGLSIRQTTAVLSWIEGGISDEELRKMVTLGR